MVDSIKQIFKGVLDTHFPSNLDMKDDPPTTLLSSYIRDLTTSRIIEIPFGHFYICCVIAFLFLRILINQISEDKRM